MTFSLRSILLVMAVVGIWLGAVLSKSAVAVELASAATNLFLFLSVAVAISHPQTEQRRFWLGFCMLGLGNLLFAHFSAGYQLTRMHVVAQVLGRQEYGWQTYLQSIDSSTMPTSFVFPIVPRSQVIIDPYFTGLQRAVDAMLSLLTACAGGWLVLWIARPAKAEADK